MSDEKRKSGRNKQYCVLGVLDSIGSSIGRQVLRDPRMRWLAIDIESEKTSDDVGGWMNKHKMGIAVLCVMDFYTGEKFIFSDGYPEAKPLNDIYDFLNGNILIGYNIKSFDLRLLLEQFLKEGRDVGRFVVGIFDVSVKRLPLGNLTSAMFGDEKLMKGADAPKEWKKGGVRRDKVVEYCMDDVAKTISVLNHGLASGFVTCYDTNGEKKQIPVAWCEDISQVMMRSLAPECMGGFRVEKKGWQCARCAFKKDCLEISR